MCCTSDTGLPGSGGGVSTLVWGNEDIGALADNRFLSPAHDFGLASLVDVMQFPAPAQMTLRNLFARHNTANGNGANVTYTVMVNGVATALTVTLATGAVGQASNLVNAIAVLQGDRISLRATKGANIANGAIDAQISLQVS